MEANAKMPELKPCHRPDGYRHLKASKLEESEDRYFCVGILWVTKEWVQIIIWDKTIKAGNEENLIR